MLGIKLNHVSKRGHNWRERKYGEFDTIVQKKQNTNKYSMLLHFIMMLVNFSDLSQSDR